MNEDFEQLAHQTQCERIAKELLYPLWRGVSPAFKRTNRGDAWAYFGNFVATSARQRYLSAFLGQLNRFVVINMVRNGQKQVLAFQRALSEIGEKTVLRLLTKDIDFLMLLVQELATNDKNARYDDQLRDLQLEYDIPNVDIELVLTTVNDNPFEAVALVSAWRKADTTQGWRDLQVHEKAFLEFAHELKAKKNKG